MTDAAQVDQSGLGLRHYFDVIRRRKWILLAVLVAAVAAAIALSLLQEKTYRATTKIVVGQGNSLFQPGQANAVQPFTLTMGDLVESNVVAENVIGNLRLAGETPSHLLGKVSVSINPETAVLKISVVNADEQRAVQIAQEIALVFSQLVKERFGSAAPSDSGIVQLPLTATIFDPAHADPRAVSPRPVRNTALAVVLGLVLGLLAAFLREHFDRQLRAREDVELAFGVPVIGQIPFARTRRREHRAVVESGEMAEAFRALRANLQYLGVKRPLQTILVTSASPEQGKTTVTANLAVAIARSGASTAVLEGDLRRPRLGDAFEIADEGPGLTSVLVGAVEAEAAARTVSVSGDGGGIVAGRVDVIPSGPLPPNPSELLSSFQMRDLLEQLTRSHEYVLIDSPPLLAVADALELARMVDGVVLVVRRNRATTDDAREVRALVERLEINLVGVVFTDVPRSPTYGYGEDDRRRKELRSAPPPVAAEPEPAARDEF